MSRVIQGLMIDKVIITKVARIVSVMFLRKIKKFSFVILTIIRTRKRLRTHFNNASNVNKIITMTS